MSNRSVHNGDSPKFGKLIRPGRDKKFLFRCRKVYLEYNRGIDPRRMESFLRPRMKPKTGDKPPWISFYCSVNENDNPMTTHVLIDTDRRYCCQVLNKMDYHGSRPKWRAISSVYQWDNVLERIELFEQGLEELDDEPPIEDDEDHNDERSNRGPRFRDLAPLSFEKKYDTFGNPVCYNNLKSMHEDYEPPSTRKVKFDPDVFKWSYLVLKLINQEVDSELAENRLIHWLYSCRGGNDGEGGGVGKSTCGLWLNQHFKNWLYISIGNDKASDVTRMIQNKRNEQGWDKFTEGIHGIYFDIDRSVDEVDGLINLLESITNGIVRCPKYNSKIIELRHYVHVVVTANFPPEMVWINKRGRKKVAISPGRLRIYEIMDKDRLMSVNVNRLLQYQRDDLDARHNKNSTALPMPDYNDDALDIHQEGDIYPKAQDCGYENILRQIEANDQPSEDE